MNSNAPASLPTTHYADQKPTPTILQFNTSKRLGHLPTLLELTHYMTTNNAHFALIQEPGTTIAKLPSQFKALTSGRTAIIYNKSYSIRPIPEGTFCSPPLDATEIEVTLPTKLTFRLVSFYRPPTINNITTPTSPLLQYFHSHLNVPSHIIMGGDCNIHTTLLGCATNNPPLASRRLTDFIEALDTGGCLNDGRKTRLGYPSALRHVAPSAIDITLWNSDDPATFCPGSWTPGPQLKSDHRTILIEAPFLDTSKSPIPPHPNRRQYIVNRKLTNITDALDQLPARFLHHLSESKLTDHPLLTSNSPTATSSDIDDLTSHITTIIQLAAANVHLIKPAPKTYRPPRLRHYNWTKECALAKKTRDKTLRKLRRTKKRTQDPAIIVPIIQEYRINCQALNTTILNAKRTAWRDTCSTLTAATPTGHIWKHFKKLSKTAPTTATALPTIRRNDSPPASHPLDQASLLAEHFAAISSLDNIPPDSNYDQEFFDQLNTAQAQPTQPYPATSPHISDPISHPELQHALRSLNKKSSPGSDSITYQIISALPPPGLSLLLSLYNLSLRSGYVPKKWRIAEITPLPKTPNPSTTTDFRPISLLSCLGKTLEKIIHRRIMKHLDIHNLNHPDQAGFTRNRSTTLQILRVIQTIHNAWDAGDDLLYLSLDISKAFDTVWRKGLIHKLKTQVGLNGPILNWLTSFLGDREAYVKVQSATSTNFNLENSVPQGSILAATLFAIYISDLPKTITHPNSTALYADDSNLLCPISRTDGPIRDQQLQIIQSDLDRLLDWGAKWRLNFHKLQLLIFTPHGSNSHNTIPNSINLSFHQRNIQPNQQIPVRILGVWLDTHLSMTQHIEKVIARVQPRIDILRYVSGKTWGADRATLLHLYTTWIRPIIEYCSPAYAAANPKLLRKLDQLQVQALKIVTGSSNLASSVALHAILRLPTLDSRRLRTAAKLYAKLQRGDPRDACIKSWTDRPRSTHTYSNRHNQNPFQVIPHRLRHTPFDIIAQSAFILDIATQDNSPEPLQPHDPELRYKTETSLHPSDAPKKLKTFGPAGTRTPDQQTNALNYALSTIHSYKIELPETSLLIFTDGSSNPDHIGGGGIGVIAYRPDDRKVWSITLSTPRISTSYSTELTAIDQALQKTLHISSKEPNYVSDIVVFSDCQSAVHTARQPLSFDPELRSEYWTTRNSIANTKSRLRMAGVSVTIEWIPGHTTLPQNEEADRLAKLAATRSVLASKPDLQVPTPLSTTHLHINARSNHISNTTILSSQTKAKTMFRHTNGQLPPDNSYAYTHNKTSRKFQVTIDRLTIGDHLFNNRLTYLDPSIPPTCDHCPHQDGISHRLLQCPHYQTQRQALRKTIRQIPTLRHTQLSLEVLLGNNQNITTNRHRNHLIKSLTDFLKATNLVIPNRTTGPNANPPPPH